MTSEELREKANGLRRAVQYGVENGKKNIIADLDVLTALFRGEIPVGGNEFAPEDVSALLYDVKGQHYDEAWMHAACLTIAETGERWGENVKPSPAMEAVYNLRLHRDAYNDAAHEAKAALYGCREVLGSVANIQHAIDLLITAINFPTNPPSVVSGFDSRELTPTEHTEERIKNATEGAVDAYDE